MEDSLNSVMLYSFQKFHTYDFISSPNNFSPPLSSLQAALVAQVVKNLPAVQEMWVPGLGRSAGEGRGNPLQCSCLENPIDRGAWQAIAHGVAKSQSCPSL